MIARGSQVAFAKQCLMEPSVQRLIIRRIILILRREIATLCSDRVGSIMLGSSPNEMCEFDMHKFIEEAKEHAPILIDILISLTKSRITTVNQPAIVTMILASLCRCKRPKMSLLHKIISVIMYFGHCSKKVTAINSVGICHVIVCNTYRFSLECKALVLPCHIL